MNATIWDMLLHMQAIRPHLYARLAPPYVFMVLISKNALLKFRSALILQVELLTIIIVDKFGRSCHGKISN